MAFYRTGYSGLMRRIAALVLIAALFGMLAACGVPDTGNPSTPELVPTVATLTPSLTPFDLPTPTMIATTDHRPMLGETFTLQGGDTIVVDTGGDPQGSELQIRFGEVLHDSRCPRMVTCAVPGDAAVLFEMGLGNTIQQLTLHAGTYQPQNHAFFAGYDIYLVQLDPLRNMPEDVLTLNQYTAHLIVAYVGVQAPTPTPLPVSTPRTTINACSLISASQLNLMFGAVQGEPVSQTPADIPGQGCTIRTERGVLQIYLLLGDESAAGRMIDALRQSGIPIGDLVNDPTTLGPLAFWEDSQQAMLVKFTGSYALATGIYFDAQAQPDDHTRAYDNLSLLHNIALVRYTAGDFEELP